MDQRFVQFEPTTLQAAIQRRDEAVAVQHFGWAGAEDQRAIAVDQHVLEVQPRIDLEVAAAAEETHEHRRGPTTALAADEQPVQATKHLLPQGMLGAIVVQRDVTIFQKQTERFPLVERIADRFSQGTAGKHVARLPL